ncbi:BamA/OMP85 family outer membrane protein [Thalassoglobus polymorphus]|uniref:Outer membrane protein assembly factor BamA n=1 Tax=Thalassoglobus polymorphus TaxID=2527994 RepID=A0A517QJJ2_9PLAN|nr:BamA/TamA family outer membrane protein [Thalassoglobus polymorphus]QDT31813.1 Outer membrane protein assembly factor BamA precursor [Thalassoglobus polymorphus]
MNRVTSDTRRRALKPSLRRFVSRNALAFCIMGGFMSSVEAQRPFPGSSSPAPAQARPAPQIDPAFQKASQEEKAPPAPTPPKTAALPGLNRALAERPAQEPKKPVIQQTEFNVETLLNEELVGIVVEGNTTIQSNAILRQIDSRQGRLPSSHQIQKDVTKLLKTNWFYSVKPFYRQTKEGPVLVFQVVERPILRDVKFVGNDKIKTSELQAHTGLMTGHGYDVAANRESVSRIKSLYAEKGYRFAKVTLQKGDNKNDREVVFHIEEGPKVKVRDINFKFVGDHFISARVLKTKIATKTPIDNLGAGWIGGDYDPEIVRNDVYTIKQYYLGLGCFDVDVEVSESISEADGKVTVNFTIAEGTRYKVGNIDVIGAAVIPRNELLTKLELNSGEHFNSRFLRKDVSAMKDKYDELGHVFAKVEPTPHFRQDDSGIVDLTYQIDEDIPRYIGQINIHIRGDHTHTQETVVRDQVHRFLKPGTLASGRDLRMAQQRVSGSPIWERTDPPTFDLKPVDGLEYIPAIAQRGQNPERVAQTKAEELFSEEFDHDFDLRATYISPVKETVGRVVLPASLFEEENPPEVEIQRPLRKQPKNENPTPVVISPETVFRGQSNDIVRAQGLDQFGNPYPQDYQQGVSPQGDPFGDALSNPAPGFVDVNIDVTEGRTGRLMFGVGVNSDAGVVGQLTLQEDNFDLFRVPRSWADVTNGQAFRGAGQSFRMEAVPGSEVSRYLMSWQDPFFMGTDFSLGLSGFYYNRFYDDWTEDRLGGRISLGYVLNRYWSASTALRLENVQIRDYSLTNGPVPPDLLAVDGDNFLSTASFTLSFDTRDNSFNPSQGHNFDLTYEQGFGEFIYPRIDASAGKYFTLYERPDGLGKHILSLTGQAGWTGDDTPIFERYYAGGYSSFRGFEFRGVTPREGNFAVGGDFMALGSAEYMFPLTATDNIRAVVFSDFGTVEPEAGFDDFRVTAGFGFRMVVPAMGPAPLAFDFAWPILQQDEDETRVFSFYVGLTR